MREKFTDGLRLNQTAFGLALSDDTIDRLAKYCELIQQHNELLHLVAPTSPEEFATRHILESLTLLTHLPDGARFADVGPGAGLPSIPCLIARGDLKAVLIESKDKKSRFLQTVLAECQLADRAEIFNRQFAEIKRPDVSYVTCRALDRFVDNLPRLVKWSRDCTLLFFGGPALEEKLNELRISFQRQLLPMSTQRFLFDAKTKRRRVER